MSFNLETRQMVLEMEREIAVRRATRDARLGPAPPRTGFAEWWFTWLTGRPRSARPAVEAAVQAAPSPNPPSPSLRATA
jgi:hypothetical protein